MFKAAIFDMDGTLIDSMQVWEHIGDDYLLSKGITPPKGMRSQIERLNLKQVSEYFVEHFPLNCKPEKIVDEVNAMLREYYCFKIPPKPGVYEFLDELKRRGIPMCIATATGRHLSSAVLERLKLMDYFEFFITCNEVNAPKDRPTIFIEAAKRLGYETRDTIVFEDAIYAARSAKQAGCRVLALYDTASAHEEQSLRSVADWYAYSLKEAKELLF